MIKNKRLVNYNYAARAFLMPWQEAQGILHRVRRIAEAVFLTLAFNSEYVEIEIPLIKLQTNIDNIGELIGKQVSILRTEARFYLISSKRARKKIAILRTSKCFMIGEARTKEANDL